tara:strand:- start:107 stop:592 length:486 start_codon:yes stop_codon:yes gene_type:complete
MIISLSESEMQAAGSIGVSRYIKMIVNGLGESRGSSPVDGWQRQVEGAMGEMAAAKGLKMYPTAFSNRMNEGDLGSLEVRTTFHKQGRLRLNQVDDPSKRYVHVVGSVGQYQLKGWAWGHEVLSMEPEEMQPGRPAYYLPNERLSDLVDLLASLRWEGDLG